MHIQYPSPSSDTGNSLKIFQTLKSLIGAKLIGNKLIINMEFLEFRFNIHGAVFFIKEPKTFYASTQ